MYSALYDHAACFRVGTLLRRSAPLAGHVGVSPAGISIAARRRRSALSRPAFRVSIPARRADAIPHLQREGPLVLNAADQAVDLIRSAILEGRLTPGQRLKEAEVAEAFGISRTPVREAMRILQNSGLLDGSPNRGSVVRSYSMDQLRESYELRMLLEGYAARRAAMACSPELVQRLSASCERFEALRRDGGPVVELVKENIAFHNTIIDAAASERVSSLLRAVVELPLMYRVYYWYQAEQVASSERQHLQLVNAIERKEADRAELIMRAHILEAWDVMQAHIAELGFERFVDRASAELAALGQLES